jgi:hypothetical protein
VVTFLADRGLDGQRTVDIGGSDFARRALAEELNRRGIQTAHGGKWHYTTVVRMLKRQGLLAWGTGARVNNGQAKKHVADVRAEALASTLLRFRMLASSPSMPSHAS